MHNQYSSPNFELLAGRRGVLLSRWRGTLAYTLGRDNSPYHDKTIAPILGQLDNATARYIAREFIEAFEDAGRRAHEISLERLPQLPPPAAGRKVAPAALSFTGRSKFDNLTSSFRWYGQFAYAKGIDRSPSHDPQTVRRLEAHSNDLVVVLLRAWEAGWDSAHDIAQECAMERHSLIEAPAIISARKVRNPTRKTHKQRGQK